MLPKSNGAETLQHAFANLGADVIRTLSKFCLAFLHVCHLLGKQKTNCGWKLVIFLKHKFKCVLFLILNRVKSRDLFSYKKIFRGEIMIYNT